MRRNNPEQQIQRAVCHQLQWRKADGVEWWHVPNGGWRSRTEASIFKGLGVQAGVPDLHFLYNGRFYALELKAPRGKLSRAQQDFIHRIRLAGGAAEWANGIDEAIAWLEHWGLLRTQRQAA